MPTGKIIKHGLASQSEVLAGVVSSVNAIKTTLGPSGRCVAIDSGFTHEISRDGATVAKSIQFSDPNKNMGAGIVKKAASRTEEQAGDGTSTTSLLIGEMATRGQRYLKSGANVNEIKSGMLKAMEYAKEFVASQAIPVEGDLDKIKMVATISANNDPEVGDLIAEGMKAVGFDGILTADLSSGLDTSINVVEGMKIERGWASPAFVNKQETGKNEMDMPYVLVCSEKLNSVNQLVNLFKEYTEKEPGTPILIICDDMDESVMSFLVYNVMRSALACAVVKGIDFGDGRKNLMEDIAVAVGATHFCPETGTPVASASMQDLGRAKKIVVSRESTIIYGGHGDKTEIADRVAVLKAKLASPEVSEYDKTKFGKRVAGLSGGIGVIKAGGASEVEKLNRKQTIEDAILASESAIAEGYVPGGGYVYVKAADKAKRDKNFWKGLAGDETAGAEIVFDSLPSVLKTIAENSGVSGDVVLEKVLSSGKKEPWGYNAKAKTYGYLLTEGILDSAKVLRVALENSVSAASMVLLIDCTITEEPTKSSCGCDTLH